MLEKSIKLNSKPFMLSLMVSYIIKANTSIVKKKIPLVVLDVETRWNVEELYPHFHSIVEEWLTVALKQNS